ncbi:hypothetical protein Q7F20_03845 [Curtobacterium sp. A7_M15]|uniref:hypothetical protein n=1 Tax=Curtobacterium sp. A7_M15 TaxID=3065241 RepID=UPI002737803C|nr:hypothetical protein [Curtobacterium sp. A7_M15]MDP4332490.1 hypothetical protein [Curtobacterium sp. A7_M15]
MNHEFVDAATLQIDRAQVLLDAALPHHGAVLSVIHEQPSNSIMLGTGAERGATALLYAGGEHVARLRVSVRYRWQAHHAALAVEESRFTLFLTTDRQPLVRFEFQDARTNTPRHTGTSTRSAARSARSCPEPATTGPGVVIRHASRRCTSRSATPTSGRASRTSSSSW